MASFWELSGTWSAVLCCSLLLSAALCCSLLLSAAVFYHFKLDFENLVCVFFWGPDSSLIFTCFFFELSYALSVSPLGQVQAKKGPKTLLFSSQNFVKNRSLKNIFFWAILVLFKFPRVVFFSILGVWGLPRASFFSWFLRPCFLISFLGYFWQKNEKWKKWKLLKTL